MSLTARELIDLVLDADSWQSWDEPPTYPEADDAYRDTLARAKEKAGTDESLITGTATLRGRRVAVIVGEFGFLAGSIGRAAADRLVAAVERATREGLPLLAAPISGGTRMQEGTPAFVQMVRITAAVAAHKEAGLPYLVWLRNPTTGGVMASWGSLGHLTAAEPEALVGFLGPRVFEVLYGEQFPAGVQTPENLRDKGIIDAVLAAQDLAEAADRVLTILCATKSETPDPVDEEVGEVGTWEAITSTRREDRPGVRDLLASATSHVVLNGTGAGERDPGVVIALALFGGQSCVVAGQDRVAQREQAMGPGALRAARRAARLAGQLNLPLLTVIDTAGADLSKEAEEGAMAGEIARTIEALVRLPTPTVSLLLGEGNGGGALALLPADRVLAAQRAWLSPLPPEGASAIVHRDRDHAAEMAESQQVLAIQMRQRGHVDRIIAESPDAADEPEAFCARVSAVLTAELANLSGPDLARRANRFRG